MGMHRGIRGGGFTSRGSSYRGGGRGSWHPSSRGYGGSPRGGRFNSSHNHNSSFSSNHSYDRKYSSSSDKYGGTRSHHVDDYRRSYKPDSGSYSSRDHRSPDRKRMRTDSSHDRSFGGGSGGEYKNRYESDRRSFSHDGRRTPSSYTARSKDEFRKPTAPMGSPRGGGGYRGRGGISSRGGGSLRSRPSERPPLRRRLVESSYTVRRRVLKTRPHRQTDYARRLQINKMRSAITRRPKKLSSDNSDEEDDKPVSVKLEATSDKEDEEHNEDVKSPKKEKKDDAGSDQDEKKESDGDTEKKSPSTKLTCPHCSIRFSNSVKYSMHLQSGQHAASMRRVATKQKTILSQMRLVQRKAQRELEKTTDDLAPRTSWCPMCKLNYKQPKTTHQASKAHLDMKRFLMPHCKICKITFKSPMIYESHCCSINHIRRKQALADRPEKDDASGNEEDLENFMTIDSVGDIGDVDEDGDQVMKDDKKEQVNVGIEEIHKVEVFYCDLCRMYLPRVNDDEEMNKEIARHCKQRTHLQKYIRYKEDKELAKKAERLVRKENAEKEKEKSDEKKEVEVKEPEKSVEEAKPDLEDVDGTVDDDKFYELPITNEKSAKSDEEDEDEDSVANGERYDRFRQSEKDEKKVEPAPIEEAKAEVSAEDGKI